jgi:hemerythrin superfamily protein
VADRYYEQLEAREPDAVDLLVAQHAAIEELFLLAGGSAGDARRDAFNDLVRLLTVHETAEEEVIHPLASTLVDGGDALINDRLDEERQAKTMLAALVDAGPDHEGFDMALLSLREVVLVHARREERYEFPQLRQRVPAEQLRALAGLVRAAEAVAPTRPHPGAETAIANIALAPALAVIDRLRDLVREAVHKERH